MKRIVIGLVCLLALVSCHNANNGNDDKVIAKVYDKVLYQSDLQNVMYQGISHTDSIVRAKSFIDKWIRRQLLIHEAEENIDKSELDFSKQIEEYRNSLIIYRYETIMIEKNLDTVVSDRDIANYIEKGNVSMDMDENAIRSIILNMRKKELIERMNNSLYNKAVKNGVFEIY
ncbi:MAG: hypothetical protein J6X10_03135 [Bacteroidales bacterium]|nr:hypothetical protein [Bacteroidales bacterium]